MKRIRELPPQPVGACLFPAVMAIFSGIEFLGALDFPKPFDRHDDEEHFKHFWSQIYQTDPRKCSGADASLRPQADSNETTMNKRA